MSIRYGSNIGGAILSKIKAKGGDRDEKRTLQ
jgi:hypothetical protein